MLYNGEDPYPARGELRLSDSFMGMAEGGRPMMELAVEVINVNLGKNPELLSRSNELRGYAVLTDKIQHKKAKGTGRSAAIKEAVDECLAEGVLSEFLTKHRNEVEGMLSFAYDEKLAREAWREEGLEEGLEKGREEGLKLGTIVMVKNLKESNLLPLEEIARIANLTIEEVKKV